MLIRSGALEVIVIDSVAALRHELKSKATWVTATWGLQARLMSQALRKLTGGLSKSKHRRDLYNQLREKNRRVIRLNPKLLRVDAH